MCQFCGAHGNNNRVGMISNIHSNFKREIFNEDLFVPDNEETREKRYKVSIIPDNANYLKELGDALCYQMRYREAIECFKKAHELRPSRYEYIRSLAIRYLQTLQIDKARQCFLWCIERIDDKLDEQYRLALLDYYEGNYIGCMDKLEPCYEMSKDNGEMYVAILYWDVLCRVKLKLPIESVLNKYSEDIDCGHHIGYQQALRLFKSDDLNAVDGVEGHGELASSLYIYGLYHYYIYKEQMEEATKTFNYLLTLDTYFSSFAFLGAITDYMRMEKEKKLINTLKEYKKVAVAFSGGVDSTFLLYSVKKAGILYQAYYVRSSLQAQSQVDEAIRVANSLGVSLRIIDADVMSNKDITNNTDRRCYYCKKTIFSTIQETAKKEGYNILLDGTNLDDTFFMRPGAQAIEELKVLSPLKDSKLNKNEIRELMREANIIGADKPANSCLATRVKVGEALSLNNLGKVEISEKLLQEMGYIDYRARINGNTITLEFNKNQKSKAEAEFKTIQEKLKDYIEDVKLSEFWR